MPGNAKPKAKGAPRAGKPRKPATGSRVPMDWRGETLARMRALILEAVPDVVEEVKWRKPSNAMQGVPVWSHDGIVCLPG